MRTAGMIHRGTARPGGGVRPRLPAHAREDYDETTDWRGGENSGDEHRGENRPAMGLGDGNVRGEPAECLVCVACAPVNPVNGPASVAHCYHELECAFSATTASALSYACV